MLATSTSARTPSSLPSGSGQATTAPSLRVPYVSSRNQSITQSITHAISVACPIRLCTRRCVPTGWLLRLTRMSRSMWCSTWSLASSLALASSIPVVLTRSVWARCDTHSRPPSLDNLAELQINVWDWDAVGKNDFMYDRSSSGDGVKLSHLLTHARSLLHQGPNDLDVRQGLPPRVARQVLRGLAASSAATGQAVRLSRSDLHVHAAMLPAVASRLTFQPSSPVRRSPAASTRECSIKTPRTSCPPRQPASYAPSI